MKHLHLIVDGHQSILYEIPSNEICVVDLLKTQKRKATEWTNLLDSFLPLHKPQQSPVRQFAPDIGRLSNR